MDSISKKVQEMYRLFPYPVPTTEIRKSDELLNLLRIFELENSYKIEGRRILDAGTGTGHRLLRVASHFKDNSYSAIDFSEKSIGIAKEIAKKNSIKNIDFRIANLMEDLSDLGKFDVVLCMGVLHHLANPKEGLLNLTKILNQNGVIFLYLYGKLGSTKRMIRKKIVSLLLNNKKSDYQTGINLIKELKFDDFDYGWNLSYKTEDEKNSLIVDAFLHINEKLYDVNDIHKLMSNSSDLFGYSIFGITRKSAGVLFDTRINAEKSSAIQFDLTDALSYSPLAKELYDSLSIKEKCKVLDLLYEPNGYTIIGLTRKFYNSLPPKNRIKQNLIRL